MCPDLLQGSGGSDCDFTPYVLPDWSVTFESVQNPGAHLGVLPTGQLTAPAQTTKDTDASHFKIFLLVSSMAILFAPDA